MNRRWIVLLATLVLLLAAGAAGAEQGRANVPLMTVMLSNGETRTPAGSAVPLSGMALVASSTVLPKEGETLEITDGIHTWVPDRVMTDRTGMLAVLFMDSPEPALPAFCSLAPMDRRITASECSVITSDPQGAQTALRIQHGTHLVWQDYPCMLAGLSGEAAPGSPVMTDDGELVGLILAQYAEGNNRYMMLTADGLVQMLAEIIQQTELAGVEAPEGLAITTEANRATIDWSEAEFPKQEGQNAYVVISDTENTYLTYFPADTGLTQVRMLLTPGRTYVVGFVISPDAPDRLPEKYAVISLPEAMPLTENGFRPILCALTADPADAVAAGKTPEVLERITEEQLRSGDLYFYSASTYQVAEEQQETLLVTLTAPDGNNYRYESGWIYGPEYQENDVWYFSLKEGGLLDSLEGNLKGQYRMAFYVGGALADSFTFEVE